jgi:hypothetical protein
MPQNATEPVKVFASVNTPELEPIFKSAYNISDLRIDDDRDLVLRYRDKDKDLVTAFVTQFDSDRLRVMMAMNLPEDHYIAGLVAATAWNGEKFSHNTFAYVSKAGDKLVILLESHLLLRGGVTEENLRAWIENFIRSINPFETKVQEVLPSVGDDSKFSKSGFWGAIGQMGAGFLEGLAGSPS